ncbi:hypothetical protein EI42_05512 [Thermosporothrix hazakensis]|jgi:hypothetical protein|uniref:Uncharacterized protein n=1 Tax=Thermosporothrix hazakensis TaxID=644383 RepID=A0A326TYQ1_THEHA|nr:DUF5691 domain-containing protein [Thermosporothrix hazakensis]PZW22379.1 hypothetical protein EI42_05512 [Thermosporothrix hazakensis]GCE49132.1 hypothetical protein KTH_40010 [Thermosporothrix hazakensis]
MNKLITTAIVGTGQIPQPDITTGTPVDTLSQQLSGDIERKLLLTAGVLSNYQQAGQKAPENTVSFSPAPPERLPVFAPASSTLETIITNSQKEHFKGLLLDACRQLQAHKLILPFHLMPQVLNPGLTHQNRIQLRYHLAAVLGERGRWLSQFYPEWSWVATYQALHEQDLTTLHTLWQEEGQSFRHEVLRRVRAIEPDTAREWLQTSWNEEKAEARALFVSVLSDQLSEKDLPFLEKAFSDRSARVCGEIAKLLVRMPKTAFARKVYEQAPEFLTIANGTCKLHTLSDIGEPWLTPTKNQPTNATVQLLALVPPRIWEERTGLTPEDIINSAEGTRTMLIEILAAATILHRDVRWARALLDRFYREDDMDMLRMSSEVVVELCELIPAEEAEAYMERVLTARGFWLYVLPTLPQPWSENLSARILDTVRSQSTQNRFWHEQLDLFAAGIAPSYLAQAIETLQQAKEQVKEGYYIESALEKTIEAIQIRKNLIEELP